MNLLVSEFMSFKVRKDHWPLSLLTVPRTGQSVLLQHGI